MAYKYSLHTLAGNTLKVGVVGFGPRMQALCAQMRALALGFEIVLVAELLEDRAKLAEQTFPHARIVRDWRDIPPNSQMPVLAVIVGNEDVGHCDAICGLAGEGHAVLSEKPMGVSLEQCRQIARCIANTGTLYATLFEMPHAPLFAACAEIIASGGIGKLVHIDMVESIGHEHFQDSYTERGAWPQSLLCVAKCIHDMHLLSGRKFAGAVKRLRARGGREHFVPANKPNGAGAATNCIYCAARYTCNASAQRYIDLFEEGDFSKRPIPAISAEPALNPELTVAQFTDILRESPHSRCVYSQPKLNATFDTLQVEMEHARGATSCFRATVLRGNRITRRFRIQGTEGTLAGDLENDALYWNGERVSVSVDRTPPYRHDGSDEQFLRLFANALHQGDWSELTGTEESLHAHEIAFTVHESIAQGGVVCTL